MLISHETILKEIKGSTTLQVLEHMGRRFREYGLLNKQTLCLKDVYDTYNNACTLLYSYHLHLANSRQECLHRCSILLPLALISLRHCLLTLD